MNFLLEHFPVYKLDTPLEVHLYHEEGTTDSFPVNHTYNEQQIKWFKAGAALNIIRREFENSKKQTKHFIW